MGYFTLHPYPPFRLDLTVWVLRRQPHNAMDLWKDDTYVRTWIYDQQRLSLRLWQTQTDPQPRLEAEIYEGPDDARAVDWVRERLSWVLGLDRAPDGLACAESEPRFAALLQRYRGLRPPRFDSLYEGLINAVACQQVSLYVGITLLNRLCRLCAGESAHEHSNHPFPSPERLLEQDPAFLRDIGFSRQKIRSLRAVAETALEGELDERDWQHRTRREIESRLTRLPGIGRWSVEYVLLRALGRIDVFPGDDVGGRRGLLRWLGEDAKTQSYEDTLHRLRPWSACAGLLYFFMLLRRLEEEGFVTGAPAGKDG